MARNDRAGSSWSHSRRPPPVAKSRVGCVRGTGAANLDGLGDIVNLLSTGERNCTRKESWSKSWNETANSSFPSGDCCLKNGRVQCSCSWSKNNYSPHSQAAHKWNFNKTLPNDFSLPYERKKSSWSENKLSNGHFVGNRMAEEYVLDDNELCFLDFYDIPVTMPKKQQIRKVGKVRTVSIIDTLSELASGATDREDEGGFSSAVSESAILGRDPLRSHTKHGRHVTNRRGRGLRESYPSTPLTSAYPTKVPHCSSVLRSSNESQANDNFQSCHESPCELQIKNFSRDDPNFTCSSLKRTLKYLRKAVSSNVVEEEVVRPKRYTRRHDEKDFRQCFSDSEVPEVPKPWIPTRRDKPDLNSRAKSRSLLAVATPNTVISSAATKSHFKLSPSLQGWSKTSMPDWIQQVFIAAKKGELEKLKEGLIDVDAALVRNLSDDHGNNLWHICATQNNVQCLDWLCAHNQQHIEALKDENKHGFTPAALAVKHGSLLAVQWLIHNTPCKMQLLSSGDKRSLLHIAAKYGQETIVQWLLSYMSSQDIDINGLDSEGNTALHLAAKHGHISCIKALILHGSNIKARNERGQKPLNLAVKYLQSDCAEYLTVMESCFNLASVSLRQQAELQHLQKENAEVKSYFKELLSLTRRLQNRQRELIQTITRTSQDEQPSTDNNARNIERYSKYVDDYSQLLASVMTDEEHRLLVVEGRWKKSRAQPKLSDCKKTPLDVIKSQFGHISDKMSDNSPAIPSTPETSDDSWGSGEEDSSSSLPLGGSAANILMSTPDVVHSVPVQHVPVLNSVLKYKEKSLSPTTKSIIVPQSVQCAAPICKSKNSSDIKTSVRSVSGNARDVNLQMFFKQNPNLRQASETCSVLEVLEPSSSDSDDCRSNKRRSAKNANVEEHVQSSSSSADTLSPSSCGPSSSGSKASGSRSSSSGSRQDNIKSKSENVQNIFTTENGFKSLGTENKTESGSDSTDKVNNVYHAKICDSNCLAEPDLIRGTLKKKCPVNHSEQEKFQNKELCVRVDTSLTDNPSASTDSESLEADRSFCSAVDTPNSVLSGQIQSDIAVASTSIKKKGFLLKFALRGKWPSKHRPRSLKNEISPEEFRETYSRSSPVDNSVLPNLIVTGEQNTKKSFRQQSKDEEKVQDSNSFNDEVIGADQTAETKSVLPTTRDVPCPAPPLCDEVPCPVPPCGDVPRPTPSCSDISRPSAPRTPLGLLPPRRDPPPAPPPGDDGASQLNSDDDDDDDVSISIPKSSSSCVTSCPTPAVPHESIYSEQASSYVTNNGSDLWQPSSSKPLFRPASSASRVESPSRAEDSFPLNKSASNEMLSALDGSTAGRQSPAPSEVSKTESALSPPSDVSKTESTRYLSQLGKIEETNHLSAIKVSNMQKTSSDDRPDCENFPVKEAKTEVKKKKSGSSKKSNPDKPWYEFSDEEDVITPQRYKVVTGSIRSSSEDEAVVN